MKSLVFIYSTTFPNISKIIIINVCEIWSRMHGSNARKHPTSPNDQVEIRGSFRADIPFSLSRRLYINYRRRYRGGGDNPACLVYYERGGLASFGHENSAPLVAQNHPPSIDPYSVLCFAPRRKRGREKYVSRGEARNGRPLRKQFNIRAREKRKEERRSGEKESRGGETLLGLMKRVLIRDTFRHFEGRL